MKEYVRTISDYPVKGIQFRDITTLIKNDKAFSECINQIIERSKRYKIHIKKRCRNKLSTKVWKKNP